MIFTTSTDQEIQNTVNSTELGITTDMSVKESTERLVSELIALKETLLRLTSNPSINTIDASKISTAALKVSKQSNILNTTPVLYDVTPNQDNTALTWDMTQFLSSIPSTHVLRKVSVVGSGVNTTFNSDKKVATIEMAPANFPVTLDIQVRTDSPDGQYLFTETKEIGSTAISSTIPLTSSNLIAKEVSSQEDLNSHLLREIESIRRKLI